MKESIGSTILLTIIFIFFVIIISFMAVIINYAKVFTIKNGLVTIIEQYQGYETTEAKNQIDEYLRSKNYPNDEDNVKIDRFDIANNESFGTGVENQTKYYYQVIVYSTFKIPMIKQSLMIPVKGNTKEIIATKKEPIDIEYKEIPYDLN